MSLSNQNINWFPGHMAKTRRLISENLKNVDIVIELLDARIPRSSENPEIARLIGDKPSLTLFNKASLADPKATRRWQESYKSSGRQMLAVDFGQQPTSVSIWTSFISSSPTRSSLPALAVRLHGSTVASSMEHLIFLQMSPIRHLTLCVSSRVAQSKAMYGFTS